MLAAALAAAFRVTICGVPALTLTDAGLAVTPAGSPVIATATVELNPLIAVTLTDTCADAPPPVSATVAGVTERLKSGAGLLVDPQPTVKNRRQAPATRFLSMPIRMPESHRRSCA